MSIRKPLVPFTDYKEPSDPTPQIGLVSLILNGNTADGGLRSITYKAVYAALLVEELDMARNAVIAGESQLTKITDSEFTTQGKIAQLSEEVAALKREKNPSILTEAVHDEVSLLNGNLDTEIRASKNVTPESSKKVLAFKKEARGFNQKYAITKLAITKNARKMEDVAGFDTEIYLRAAERRREEEQQKIENERLLVEQQKQSQVEAKAQAQAQAEAKAQAQAQVQAQAQTQTQIEVPAQTQNEAEFQQVEHIQPLIQQQQPQQSVNGHDQIPELGLGPEGPLHLPEPTLDDLSYAIDSETLMVPGYADSYIAQPPNGSDQLVSMPPLDGSYVHSPGPQ